MKYSCCTSQLKYNASYRRKNHRFSNSKGRSVLLYHNKNNKLKISINKSKYTYQLTPSIYITRTNRELNLGEHESVPAIIRTPKKVITKSRSVSLQACKRNFSLASFLTGVLGKTNKKIFPTILVNHFQHYNENKLNRFSTTQSFDWCRFSSEGFFQTYDHCFKQNCVGMPLSENSTLSEKISSYKNIRNRPPRTIISLEEIQGANNTNFLNIMESKNGQDTNDEGNYTNDESNVVSYCESSKSIINKVSERILKTKVEEILQLLEDKSPEQKKKLLEAFSIPDNFVTNSKPYTEAKSIDQVCTNVDVLTKPYITTVNNLYKRATGAREKESMLLDLNKTSTPLQKRRGVKENSAMAKILNSTHSLYESKQNGEDVSGENIMERENSDFECICDLVTHDSVIDSLNETSFVCNLDSSESMPASKPESISKVNINKLEKKHKKEEEGILTLLQGKTFKQKQNILRGLAMLGIQFPEFKILSDENLFIKICTDLSHLFVAQSNDMTELFEKYSDVDFIKPLENQPPEENKNTLTGLDDKNFPLFKNHANSENSSRDKVITRKVPIPLFKDGEKMQEAADQSVKSRIILSSQSNIDTSSKLSFTSNVQSSEEISEAKYKGMLLLLEGETQKQKEKILKRLVMLGIQLPEGKTDSDKKLTNHIYTDGLLPVSQILDIKKKEMADKRELESLLRDKKFNIKENVIKDLLQLGIRLPRGHSTSETKTDLNNTTCNNMKKFREREISTSESKNICKKVSSYKNNRDKTSVRVHTENTEESMTSLSSKITEGKEKNLNKLIIHSNRPSRVDSNSKKQLNDQIRCSFGLLTESQLKEMKKRYNQSIYKDLRHERCCNSFFGGLTSKVSNTPKKTNKIVGEIFDKNVIEHKSPLSKSECDLLRFETERMVTYNPIIKRNSSKASSTTENAEIESLTISHYGKRSEQNNKNLRGNFFRDIMLSEKTEMRKKHKKTAEISLQLSEASEENLQAKEEIKLLLFEGKTPKKKENLLKGLTILGVLFPEGKANSDRNLNNQVHTDFGVPPTLNTTEMKKKHATVAGLLQSLEDKSRKKKESILQGLADIDIPLPKGCSSSERALIDKIIASRPVMTLVNSEKGDKQITKIKNQDNIIVNLTEKASFIFKSKGPEISKAKYNEDCCCSAPENQNGVDKERNLDGLFIPVSDKSRQQKQKILKDLAMHGIMLPEGKTDSDKTLLYQIRKELGLPPEPNSTKMRQKYEHAAEKGLLWPLEGKKPKEKEKILRRYADIGIPLPKGRCTSERALIDKIITGDSAISSNSAVSLQSKNIHKPFAKCPCGTKAPKLKKSSSEIHKLKSNSATASPEIGKAKADGILIPLENTPREIRSKSIKGLAIHGIMLPDENTDSDKSLKKLNSDKSLIKQISTNIRVLPKSLITEMRDKSEQATDKSLLYGLPKGCCCASKEFVDRKEHKPVSKKSLKKFFEREASITKCECELETTDFGKHNSTREPKFKSSITASSEITKIKADGLPRLDNKSPERKQQLLTELAMKGIMLPEGHTDSDKKIINQVRADLGLPPEPQTVEMREIYKKAADKGLIQPLKGKTPKQKEKILKGLVNFGMPLPKGRCASEKALIEKIKSRSTDHLTVPLQPREKVYEGCCNKSTYRELDVKRLQKEESISKSCCQPVIVDKNFECECKFVKSKDLIQKHLPFLNSGTRKLLQRMQTAKDAGLLTPLNGKASEQKYQILKGLAFLGIQLPEGKTESDITLINRDRYNFALPPEPDSTKMRDLYKKAEEKGLLIPLNGKTAKEKEKIIKGLLNLGIPLPKGRSSSEIELINKLKLKAKGRPTVQTNKKQSIFKKNMTDKKGQEDQCLQLKKIDKSAAAKLRTPLEEKLLKNIIAAGLPIPDDVSSLGKESFCCLENKTTANREDSVLIKCCSDKQMPTKAQREVRKPLKLESTSQTQNSCKVEAIGIIVPLEGKTTAEKKKILQQLHDAGILFTDGRTPSEQLVINEIKKELVQREAVHAKQDGKLSNVSPGRGSPIKCKPLAEVKSSAEKKISSKGKKEKPTLIKKFDKSQTAGIIIPLIDKTPAEMDTIFQQLRDAGIGLPEGITCSKEIIVNEINDRHDTSKQGSKICCVPSEIHSAQKNKKIKRKEKLPKEKTDMDLAVPADQSSSGKPVLTNTRSKSQLHPVPKTYSGIKKCCGTEVEGMLVSLKGKTTSEKKKILRQLHSTSNMHQKQKSSSEEQLINKIKKGQPNFITKTGRKGTKEPSKLLNLMVNKTGSCRGEYRSKISAESQTVCECKNSVDKKIHVTRDIIKDNIRLPKTPSMLKQLPNKTNKTMCCEQHTPSLTNVCCKTSSSGVVTPSKKKAKEKKKKSQVLHDTGTRLTRKSLEHLMSNKLQKGFSKPDISVSRKGSTSSAKQTDIIVSPVGSKITARKEKLLKDLMNIGFSLPMSKTPSERKLLAKMRRKFGLPPEPGSPLAKHRYELAQAAGIITPLEGRTLEEKKKILQQLHNAAIPLPEARTRSEQLLINEIQNEFCFCFQSNATFTKNDRTGSQKVTRLTNYLLDKPLSRTKKQIKDMIITGSTLSVAKILSEELMTKIKKQFSLSPKTEIPFLCDKTPAGEAQQFESKMPTVKTNIAHQKHADKLLSLGTPPEDEVINELKKLLSQPSISQQIQQRSVQNAGLNTSSKVEITKGKLSKDLFNYGFFLPIHKNSSEKKILINVRRDTEMAPQTVPLRNSLLNNSIFNNIKPGLTQPNLHCSEPPEQRSVNQSGIQTFIDDKITAQKKNVLKGLLKFGFCLPISKTLSEKKLLDNVRRETGLPPEPEPFIRNRYKQARPGGDILPTDSKAKTNTLEQPCEAANPLSNGRISIEELMMNDITKELVNKDYAQVTGCTLSLESNYEQEIVQPLHESETITPKQKTPSKDLMTNTNQTSENILKEVFNFGFSTPLSKTLSEKHSLADIRNKTDLLLNRQSSSIKDTPVEKNTLQPLQGICVPLVKDKILSELRISRINQQLTNPDINFAHDGQQRSVQRALLSSPSKNKDKVKKENILQELLEFGFSLPIAKTLSEKQLLDKIRYDNGLPAEHPELLTSLEKSKILEELKDVVKGKPSSCCCSKPLEKSKLNYINQDSVDPLTTQIDHKRKKSEISHIVDNTTAQKENLLKGLITAGLPLPIAKTSSQKILINKIRRETSLLSETKDNYTERKSQNINSHKLGKDSCLNNEADDISIYQKSDLSICLPKDLAQPSLLAVNKNKNLSIPHHSSLRRSKTTECGIPTLLDDRTAMHKEQNLKRLVKAGLPLPIGKTPSTKMITDKIRCECGLPPIPNTPALRKKYKKAQAAGLITPLEGKPPAEKKKILLKLCDAGIPLPEGRTPSEKSMIKAIKESHIFKSLTPKNKTRSTSSQNPVGSNTIIQKKSYLRENDHSDLSLPVAKISQGKININKIGSKTGLLSGPNTQSTTTLDGKSFEENKNILQNIQDAGLTLPKGKTCYEKCLIDRIGSQIPEKTTGHKRRSQVVHKSLKEKEMAMRDLAAQGLPLPETKTRSDKKLAKKIRKELGLPPEPQTSYMKLKYEKGIRAGIIKPLEGLTPQAKKNLLRRQISMGIPLPKGRSPSEKLLIAELKKESRLRKTSSKSLSMNKALKHNKSFDDRERLTQRLADVGIYIPLEEQSSKELKNIQKNLARAGYILPKKSDSSKISLVTTQEKKMLKDLLAAGIPLPKNLTVSEKALIRNLVEPGKLDLKQFKHVLSAKISDPGSESPAETEEYYIKSRPIANPLIMVQTPVQNFLTTASQNAQSEIISLQDKILEKKNILQNIQAADILSSDNHEFVINKIQTHILQKYPTMVKTNYSANKLLKEIEDTLKLLTQQGLQLSDVNTRLYKKLAIRIRKELGLSQQLYASVKERYCKDTRAEIQKPLKGITLEKKKNIIRTQAGTQIDIPIHEGRSASEKSLTAHVIDVGCITKAPSEKFFKTINRRYTMALKNNEHNEKKGVTRDLAMSKLPQQGNRTPSKKTLIYNVKTNFCTPSLEKDVIRQVKADNLSNISGLTFQEENILKALGESGPPVTKGKSISDKSLTHHINYDSESLTKLTYLDKDFSSSGRSRRVDHLETINLVKCSNYLCESNNEAYKLKQKYVKIKVKSSNMTLFSPCSTECLLKIQSKILIERDGIKVAVGNTDKSTVSASSYSFCSTDSLIIVLKTDMQFNSLAKESNNHSSDEYNYNISSESSNESKLCLKVTEYCTDQNSSTSVSSSVNITPRITIYFSSQTDSNLTHDTDSNDNVDSISSVSVSDNSSTKNTQYLHHTIDGYNNNKFATTKGLVKRRHSYSLGTFSSRLIYNNSTSNDSSQSNVEQVNEDKTVIIIYSRNSKEEPNSVTLSET